MGSARWIETDTASNVDIHAATEIGSYTADADRFIVVQALIDAVAGNGDYVMWVTLQIGGAGSAYVIIPKTTMAAASGETAFGGQSGVIFVRNGDVLKVYVDGLAADTTTPDYITRFSEFAAIQPATAGRSIDVDADGKVLLQAAQSGVTIPTVTTLTNLPAVTTDWLTAAGIKADAVTKLQANLALEATLTAIKGEGWTNETLAAIDVLIDAIKAKSDQLIFTTPNKVDATATIDPTGIATSAELVAVDDKVDEILSKLNSDPLPKIGVGITGSTINAIRGDDFIEALTGVDVLEGSKCQFAIKTRRSDGDNQSLLLVDSETGMIKAKNMLNATSDMAAVTIVGGVYQLEIKAILSRSIPSGSLVWGAQIISAEGQVLEKWGGVWNQIEDTIKAVS